jgi:flagellin-like protein
MRYKKAVSALVAAVILILITVSAAGVIWSAVMPMITGSMQLNQACMNAKVWIDTQSGYSCYDEVNKQVKFMIARGAEEFNLVGVSVGLVSGAKTLSKEIRSGTANLLSYFMFDEGSGNVTADSSGNLNTGQVVGAQWSSGKHGRALLFDGINSSLNSTISSGYSDEITIEAWVIANSSGWQQVLGKPNSFYLETNGTDFNASLYIDGGWR